MNKQELAELKLKGYLQQKDKEHFSLRIVTDAGHLTTDQMRAVSEMADKYGRGCMGFTTRQCVEIPWIKEEHIVEVIKAVESAGLLTGGTGKKVEPISSCKGTVCSYGLIDTQELSRKLHKRFFAMDLPGKFKIGVVGCPNNCVTAPIHDIGFMGQKMPEINEDKCKGCRLCERNCKVKAIEMVDKVAKINFDTCINCGVCINICPFDAIHAQKEGVGVFLGGKFGRVHRVGDRLEGIYSVEEAEGITETVIKYYSENAEKGERLGATIDRLGLKGVKEAIDNR